MKKKLEVSGAILVYENKILCAQRGKGKYEYVSYKYEFPGGKLEPGESPKEALHRELIEEMEINIDINDMKEFYVVSYEYPDFDLTMHTFICPILKPEMAVKEHVDIKWLGVEEIGTLDWAPADWPVVEKLKELGINGSF